MTSDYEIPTISEQKNQIRNEEQIISRREQRRIDSEVLKRSSGINIDELLMKVVIDGASDLHLSCGSVPRYRIDGDLIPMPSEEVVTNDWLRSQIRSIANDKLWDDYNENNEVDLSHAVEGHGRFRVNVFVQRGQSAAVMRTIPSQIKTIAQLGVPDSLNDIIKKPKGLILVTGPTGSGKALRLDTKIPTPTGMTTMGELKIGDKVIDSKGQPTTVTGMSDINKAPELYKITLSDGQEIFADKDHQWIVSSLKFENNENFKSKNNNAIKKLTEISQTATNKYSTLKELFAIIKEHDLTEHYVNTEAVNSSLDFMDVESYVNNERKNNPITFNTSTALYSLGLRLEQRYENSGIDFRVMSTKEIIAEGVSDKDNNPKFNINQVKNGASRLLLIENIEKVFETDSEYGDVRCISVDSDDKSYLCADYVVTHNTTTLTAMLDAINASRQEHIMTIEDPIEFVHENKMSLVNQREVGSDTASFSEALKRVLRQDPDVILIGEMRDAETISTALTAAETGHLVFGTLHTQSSAKTIDRIIDTFPAHQQSQVRSQLADTLQAVICQDLVKKSGGGRVAATEILMRTDAISNNIREGNISQIYSALQTGRTHGMHTFDQDYVRLVKAGLVEKEQVVNSMRSPKDLDGILTLNNDWSA